MKIQAEEEAAERGLRLERDPPVRAPRLRAPRRGPPQGCRDGRRTAGVAEPVHRGVLRREEAELILATHEDKARLEAVGACVRPHVATITKKCAAYSC